MYTFGFIGTGNMGGALAQAARVHTPAEQILLANKPHDAAAHLAAKLGCTAGDNRDVAKTCQYIFLGVKPQVLPSLLAEIQPILKERTDRFILVSMAAGVKIRTIQDTVQAEYPIIRIMPNMAASVGESMILLSTNEAVTEEDLTGFYNGMSGAGRIDEIPENLMDAGCALSGSGPAFAFMFIEALADGAVSCGLPRAKALEYAAQTLLGSARLMLESGRHPEELKDAVCSPAGTTIAGVGALEAAGFRGAAMEAVKAAYQRARELS